MALLRSNAINEWPNLNRNEALKVQLNLVQKWKPTREVWSLKYGNTIIGVTAAACGLTINMMFRTKLKLFNQGFVFTNFFVGAGPALMGYMCHSNFITSDILLYEHNCSLCYQAKAISLINVNSLLYPVIVAPVINLAIAGNLGYRVPYITEVREFVKFFWSVVKPRSSSFLSMFIGNTLIASMMTHSQINSMETLANIISRITSTMESKQEEINVRKWET